MILFLDRYSFVLLFCINSLFDLKFLLKLIYIVLIIIKFTIANLISE